VIDRVSILSEPEIVNLLKTKFVPVAVDQHDHRRRQDAEGEFFAKILSQAKRTTDGQAQGFYLFTPQGKLLEFENTLSAERMKRMLAAALKKFDPSAEAPKIEDGEKDTRFTYELPEGGLVIYVTAKVLSGYESLEGLAAIRQKALGRDHLWLRKDETQALAKGELAESVQRRLARYHLIDNTRGETPMWRADEVKHLQLTLQKGRVAGSVHLETRAGDRGYQAQFLGAVEAPEGKVRRFDAVARGLFWGQGPFNSGAPKGKFPFAVAFTLAGGKGDVMEVPPGGARGNLKGYLT